MYETANKALQSAQEIGLRPDEFRQVSSAQWQGVLKRIFDRFANTGEQNVTWLWSDLKRRGATIQTDDGLRYIGSMFAPDTKVWLLLEDWDGTKTRGNYWIFEATHGAAVAVLNNIHLIEYYIVDRNFNWMAMENHHGDLIGVGEPAESFILTIAAHLATASDRAEKRDV